MNNDDLRLAPAGASDASTCEPFALDALNPPPRAPAEGHDACDQDALDSFEDQACDLPRRPDVAPSDDRMAIL